MPVVELDDGHTIAGRGEDELDDRLLERFGERIAAPL